MQTTLFTLKSTDSNEVIASYETDATTINLGPVPLDRTIAHIITLHFRHLITIKADDTSYDWEQLKALISPRKTPRDIDAYWVSAKNMCQLRPN